MTIFTPLRVGWPPTPQAFLGPWQGLSHLHTQLIITVGFFKHLYIKKLHPQPGPSRATISPALGILPMGAFSPPARWGLLDFMSVAAPPPLLLLLLLAFCRTSTTTIHAQCSLPDLNHDQPHPVFAAGPQPRPATPSVRCRTSTTTSHAQCSLPDLNHDQPRPVFAAGPQPRPSTPSVRCRTSTTTVNAQCLLPDLNSYAKSYAR